MSSIKIYPDSYKKAMKTSVRLERVFYLLNNINENYFSKSGITFNQFKILEALYHLGDLNVGTITKLTSSTPGNTTVVVKNLKRDGFISSKKDPNDNRASILTISEKGSKIIEDLFPTHAQNLHDFMQSLDNSEIDNLYYLLDKLYNQNKKEQKWKN